jgi:TFIIF-interacting CTD phosphatase-like protein
MIKNLEILLSGRTLSDIIIVDNKSSNYCEHSLNGIPITDYHGDPNDTALFDLRDYLMRRLPGIDDVRKIIK